MNKTKRISLALAVACAVAMGSFLLAETNKTRAFSWENTPAWGTWEQAKPQFKYMPPLPPEAEGVLLADDGTFIPRWYFDMLPPLRFAVPVDRNFAPPMSAVVGPRLPPGE